MTDIPGTILFSGVLNLSVKSVCHPTVLQYQLMVLLGRNIHCKDTMDAFIMRVVEGESKIYLMS